MNDQRLSFEEFEFPSKEAWIQQVIKELKGKPIEALSKDWCGIDVQPFYHQSDKTSTMPYPVSGSKNWKLILDYCEEFNSDLYENVDGVAWDEPVSKEKIWYNT